MLARNTRTQNTNVHNKIGRPMNIDDIDAVLALSGTLASHGYSDAAHTPGLIYDIIDWADRRAAQLAAEEPVTSADVGVTTHTPKAKRGKATESSDSDFEATPDPSDDPGF